MLRNCVGGVIAGSTGHRAGLSNEGNTTLPHTSTPRSHLQSQGPLPVSITPSVIDPRYSEHQEASNHQKIWRCGRWDRGPADEFGWVCLQEKQTADFNLDSRNRWKVNHGLYYRTQKTTSSNRRSIETKEKGIF